MVTESSTLPTMLDTIAEPMTNRPMMNRDKKMVTIAPKTVDQLRWKCWPTSRNE